MSKRTNMQARRRQIRRALNRAGDSIQSMGTRKINRISYGCGLSQRVVRAEIKERKFYQANHADADLFF